MKLSRLFSSDKILCEGELYGYYVSPGRSDIDRLIVAVEANYVDWDVSNPKFLEFFRKVYPAHAKLSMSAKSIVDKLVKELKKDSVQQPELINLLVGKTMAGTPFNLDEETEKLLKLFRRAGWKISQSYGVWIVAVEDFPSLPSPNQVALTVNIVKKGKSRSGERFDFVLADLTVDSLGKIILDRSYYLVEKQDMKFLADEDYIFIDARDLFDQIIRDLVR